MRCVIGNILLKQHTSYYQLGLYMLKSHIIFASNLLLLSSKSAKSAPLRFYFATKTVSLPFLSDSINEGTIASFLRKEGQWVGQDETVASVETDKITVEIKSPTPGLITKLYVKEGQNLEVGRPLFDLDPDAPQPKASEKVEKPPVETQAPKSEVPNPKTLPAQAAKSISRKQEHQIISKEFKQHEVITTASHSGGQRVQTRQAMSRLRKRVAQRLKQSQNTYAMLTTFQEVDMWEAQKARQQLGQDFLKKYSIKLGYMSFFLKAATLALLQYPLVNSTLDKEEIIRRNFIDISVAVATPTGLLVPVLRDCQKMKFHDFELGLAQLAKKGKEGKISIDDMQGGTFTITNGGTFGSLMGTPIINPPQSAILGMHAIVNRPVVRGAEIVSRPIMYLALTYDHRLLDGRDAVIFLKRIQGLVQNPKRMLLEV